MRKDFVTLPSIINSEGGTSGGYRAYGPCITRVVSLRKVVKRRRIRGHAVIRNDVRRDATGTGSRVVNRATAEGELDRAQEAAFGCCCVYRLVVAAFAGDEDGHRDDDADADAARSNHGATRKPPERPHLFHPLRPRLFIVSSHFNPPTRRPPLDRPVELSPHYSIDPTGEALCVPFASFERRLRIALVLPGPS